MRFFKNLRPILTFNMHRVTVKDENSKLGKLLIVFSVCFCCCVILALCTLPLKNIIGQGSYTVDIYTSTKCIVEHPYDEKLHVPPGGPGDKRTNCQEPPEVLNNTDARITMDKVVYTFNIPWATANGSEIGKRGFDRWNVYLNAFLFLDVVFNGNHSEELTIAKLTYEVRMGYKDGTMKGNEYWIPDAEDNWTKIFETTESRKLKCYLQPNGIAKGIRYGCNLIPFFFTRVNHSHYLINIRFRNDYVGNSVFNRDLQYIKDIELILRYQTGGHTKQLNFLKVIYSPLTIGVFLWYCKRILAYRRLLYIEKFVQYKNPFFSIWDTLPGFIHDPKFNLCIVVYSALFILYFSFHYNSFYNDTIIKQKIILRTRGNHLRKGGIKALRFMMFGVYSVTILTVMQFMYFQAENMFFKISGPIDMVQSMNSSPYLTAFLFIVFGMWNLFSYSFLIFYAPADRCFIEEHEMNVIERQRV